MVLADDCCFRRERVWPGYVGMTVNREKKQKHTNEGGRSQETFRAIREKKEGKRNRNPRARSLVGSND